VRFGFSHLPAFGFPARAAHLRRLADMPDEGLSSEDVTAHSVYDDGVLQMTPVGSPPGLAIAGEIDEDTYPALLGKLEKLAGTAEIHLNLAGVTYCDLAGLRAIIRLAGGPGSRLVLHDLPPHLRTVLGIVGWDATPGLVIDQGK
jgi:anti-anti-sigma regulatory factor